MALPPLDSLSPYPPLRRRCSLPTGKSVATTLRTTQIPLRFPRPTTSRVCAGAQKQANQRDGFAGEGPDVLLATNSTPACMSTGHCLCQFHAYLSWTYPSIHPQIIYDIEGSAGLSINIPHHLTKWVSIESISQSPCLQRSSWFRELSAISSRSITSIYLHSERVWHLSKSHFCSLTSNYEICRSCGDSRSRWPRL